MVVAAVVVVVTFNKQEKKDISIPITALPTPFTGETCQIVKEELTSFDPEPELESERAWRLRAIWMETVPKVAHLIFCNGLKWYQYDHIALTGSARVRLRRQRSTNTFSMVTAARQEKRQ